jgi:DNA-3-methyladenine glycosylase II
LFEDLLRFGSIDAAESDRKDSSMWFEKPPGAPDWKPALRHLRRVDPVMGTVIDRVGPCTLHPRRDYFVVLCKAIFTQQISTAVATILFGRFRELFPRQRPTPARVLAALEADAPEVMRRCGLSRQKAAYLKDLSRHFVDGRIPTRRLGRMSDEAVIEALVEVNGIGRWTAEMFLIFTLNRPDVLPVDDLGLREGVRVVYSLAERPGARELTEIGERWRPYRTVATWYVWRRAAQIVAESKPKVPAKALTTASAPRASRRR